MKEVKCPGCGKKLAEIGDIKDKSLEIGFEKGVERCEPTFSMGMLVIPFTCPNCNKTHMQVIGIDS